MRALAVVAIVAGALAVPAAAGVSGLYGLVTRGPLTPVCRVGVPCSGPAASIVLTFRRHTFVRTAKTGANGRYRILLPPGRYTVTFQPGGISRKPREAFVPRGHLGKANFSLDTGIR